MMTNAEKARVKELRDAFLDSAIQFYGVDLTEEQKTEFVGTNMATVDGLFAIRDGQPWRGLTDPKEIAREILRKGKIGE